ncbi:MAG: EthD family reductase [Bacteriovoracaceae bacterium]
MFKLVAIYKIPNDKDAFEKHYQEVHAPLTMKVPLLKEFRLNKIFGGPMGASDLHVIAEMCFATKDDFKSAMKSPEAAASGKDLMSFAKEIVSVHFAEETVTKL